MKKRNLLILMTISMLHASQLLAGGIFCIGDKVPALKKEIIGLDGILTIEGYRNKKCDGPSVRFTWTGATRYIPLNMIFAVQREDGSIKQDAVTFYRNGNDSYGYLRSIHSSEVIDALFEGQIFKPLIIVLPIGQPDIDFSSDVLIYEVGF